MTTVPAMAVNAANPRVEPAGAAAGEVKGHSAAKAPRMSRRIAALIPTAATAILLLTSCSDDGPVTLAKGEDVNFVGAGGGLTEQTMDIVAQEDNGEVTGEVSFEPHGSVIAFRCADTETAGTIRLGGQFTTAPVDGDEAVGDWMALEIREGEPDSMAVSFSDPGTDSCEDALSQLPDDPVEFRDVETGDDIETA